MSPQYTHGAPGSQIEGSRFLRGYCGECGEPIRITNLQFEASKDGGPQPLCSGCDGEQRVGTASPIRNVNTQGGLTHLLWGGRK